MKKRIPGYVPIGDGTAYRGETLKNFYFSKDAIEICTLGAFGTTKSKEIISVNDIVEADCFRASDIKGDATAGALAGGLLFGLPGAIVGGILSHNKHCWFCKLKKTDDSVVLFRLAQEYHNSYIIKWINSSPIKIKHTK